MTHFNEIGLICIYMNREHGYLCFTLLITCNFQMPLYEEFLGPFVRWNTKSGYGLIWAADSVMRECFIAAHHFHECVSIGADDENLTQNSWSPSWSAARSWRCAAARYDPLESDPRRPLICVIFHSRCTYTAVQRGKCVIIINDGRNSRAAQLDPIIKIEFYLCGVPSHVSCLNLSIFFTLIALVSMSLSHPHASQH